MKQARLFMICSIGLAAFAVMAPTATAVEIKTKKDCEASDGVAMKNRGVLTCTLPLMEAENRDSERNISSCSGEIISGGMFCQIIIDSRYRNSKPNCKAIEKKKVDSDKDYEHWILSVEIPMSDAWKCEREKRIEKQQQH